MSNDNYLWDKTGEPDKDVQQLEEILGTLKYQSRPLEIPEDVGPVRRNFFYPGLAIAATIAMLLVGLGLWLSLHRQPDNRAQSPNEPQIKPVQTGAPEQQKNAVAVQEEKPSTATSTAPKSQPRHRFANSSTLATNSKRKTDVAPLGMNETQRAEAENAKQQLLLALRFTSEKLNLAQKRVHGVPVNQIRNQHKVG